MTKRSAGIPGSTHTGVSRTLLLFFMLAYGISWLVFAPIILWHAPIQLIAAASFGPTLAALIVHRFSTGNYRAFPFHWMKGRSLAAAAIGAVMIILAYVVVPGLVLADPRTLNWSILTSFEVYNYSTLLGGPLGDCLLYTSD